MTLISHNLSLSPFLCFFSFLSSSSSQRPSGMAARTRPPYPTLLILAFASLSWSQAGYRYIHEIFGLSYTTSTNSFVVSLPFLLNLSLIKKKYHQNLRCLWFSPYRDLLFPHVPSLGAESAEARTSGRLLREHSLSQKTFEIFSCIHWGLSQWERFWLSEYYCRSGQQGWRVYCGPPRRPWLVWNVQEGPKLLTFRHSSRLSGAGLISKTRQRCCQAPMSSTSVP